MKTTTLAEIRKGSFFYTEKEFKKHGHDDRYIRIKHSYDSSDKTWYCPRYYFDALGNGKCFKPSTVVVVEED